ncbi:MAG: tripartite tricarboxylate transporter substrate binding protein [Betaproteobacteria bacterium]|nr:MAG: tripartite tricarboxylate transporter substrate binding protein [Betaproteobacteria bacterium]TAG84712.1 MAG: tripartite tricarboxylate transporter substrate binding protein [Betaproteobacteria bacterium]
MKLFNVLFFATLTSFATLVSVSANAQSWPSKSIRFVVPFATGGTSEIVARSVAQELSTLLGQTVFVENKPGGAGVIAMQEVMKAEPDGHTIIMGHVGTLAVNPYAMSKHPYDVNKEFAPVVLLARVPSIIAVTPDTPAKNLKEFVALAKSKKDAMVYGSAGNGSSGHLAMEYFMAEAGIDLTHVPYKGTGPMMQDMLGGRVQATFTGAPALMPQIKAGKLRALAVGSSERMSTLSDVPTVAESGYKDFETSQWYGILVPAKTPKAIIDKLAQATDQALKTSAITARFQKDDARAGGGTPEQFAAFVKREQVIWERIIKKTGLKID